MNEIHIRSRKYTMWMTCFILAVTSCCIAFISAICLSHYSPKMAVLCISVPIVLIVPFLICAVFVIQTAFKKITVNAQGVVVHVPFAKPYAVNWDELQTCVADRIYIDNDFKKFVYLCKQAIPELHYSRDQYNFRCNKFWTALTKENIHGFSKLNFMKYYHIFISFEIFGDELQKFKTFLPERLLCQLENSEEKLHAVFPEVKK